ncbi:TIGR02234 family membrane protein [Streptomyces sp. NA04227]|uniref:TIGR02234 family membrane protein n=1 Tax=Streptomyces sp. NA04227 TaxID=2742136 RepID=UPI0015912C7E|nr:TIGR02234 family membrane protein [Streptomyces sp. NA04227]QKW05949.1 TIGR02234 family membrane protein [Streptomyces sp. NA04227]
MTAVPHPRTEAATPVRSGRRSLGLALLAGAGGAAVTLLASRQRWAEGTAAVAGGDFPLTAKGGDVTGVPAALAIVGLAALVAVFAVRRTGRRVVSGLLALTGAGIVVASVLGASDSGALDEKAARATGDTAATVESLSHTPWPYVAAAGGLLLLIAGLIALRCGGDWPAMSGRYERAGAPRPRRGADADAEHPGELWKALDRGEDPTRG